MQRILTLAAALCMLLALCLPAAASGIGEEEILGSIEVTVRYDGKPVAGGDLTCIQVGVIAQSGNSLYYRRVVDGERLDNIQDPALPKELAKFAEDNSLTGETLTVGKEGKAVFQDLKAGLYLIIQKKPAEGYTAQAPFLVSVPYQEDGVYIYDVTAQAKSELERNPETVPTESVGPSNPTRPSDSNLPQTGQLNWPIPVLVLLGLGLFSIGWVLRFREKSDGRK